MSLCRRTVLLHLLNVRIVIIYPNPPVALLTYTQKDHIMSTDHSNSQRSSAISNSAVEELNNDTAIKINGAAVYTKPRTKFTQLEALVVLNDCTDVDSTKIFYVRTLLFVLMASQIEDSNEHEVCDDSFSTIQGSSSLMRSISLNSTLNPSAPSFTRPNNMESYVVEMVDLDLN